MTYRITSPVAGGQAIADTSTTRNHALGTIVTAHSPTYGTGEFIYLLGVADTVVGSVVTWQATTYQTILAPAGDNISRQIGIAMSANVASQYGWYQISGLAVAAKSAATSHAVGEGVGVASIGLVGAVTSAVGVMGTVFASVASATTSATTVVIAIQRPHMYGLED